MFELKLKNLVLIVAITLVVGGIVFAASNINFSLPKYGSEYSYPSTWPGSPALWSDPNHNKLNNNDSSTTDSTNFVISDNTPICAVFDLGQDRDVNQIIVNSHQTEWNNNSLTGMKIYMKTEASGPFQGGENFNSSYLAAESDFSFEITSIDKSSPLWRIDTGQISASARYVIVYTTGSGGPVHAITEIGIWGKMPMTSEEFADYGFSFKTDFNGDGCVNFSDVAVFAQNWLRDYTYISQSWSFPSYGASYHYPSLWPYSPNVWGDTSLNKLNNGDSVTADSSNFVIAYNYPICMLYDLGKNRAINRVVVNAVDMLLPGWGSNYVNGAKIYFKTAAAGPFHGGENFASSFLAAEASQSVTISSVDKSDPVWVLDTGSISATARYVAVYVTASANQNNGITEITIDGHPSSCQETSDLGFTIKGDLANNDCIVDLRDLAAFVEQWLAPLPIISILEEGYSDYVISVPSTATATEQWAAEELQSYIEQMSGIMLPIVSGSTSETRPTIWVAPPSTITENIPRLSGRSFGDEEFAIVVDDRNVYITGGRPRGVMYGVYELLENVWGCHWFTPDFEVIPHHDKLQIPSRFFVNDKPSFEYRDLLFDQADNTLWMVHNRIASAVGGNDGQFENKGGRMGIYPIAHGIGYIAPFDQYYQTHPELFARTASGGYNWNSHCYSNSYLYDLARAKVLEWLTTHPEAELYDISQVDGALDGCHCSTCQALIDAQGSQIAPILTMANTLANDIRQQLGGKSLTILAYNYTSTAPSTLRADPQVVVRLCLQPPFGSPIEGNFENVRQWGLQADHFWLWYYCASWHDLWVPMPNLQSHPEHLSYFKRLGLGGVMYQGAGGRPEGDMCSLKAWVWAKHLWDTSVDVNGLIDTFVTNYYGDSAAEVRQYISCMDVASHRPAIATEMVSQWPKEYQHYLDIATIGQAYDYMAAALNLAESGTIQDRVNDVMYPVRYARMVNGISSQPQISSGMYNFTATSLSGTELNAWPSDVIARGYQNFSSGETISQFKNRIVDSLVQRAVVTLSNSWIEARVVPALGAKIVSIRRVSDSNNLVNIGSYCVDMPYFAGVGETFDLQESVLSLGDTDVYSITSQTSTKLVCSATLSNGETVTKTIQLNNSYDVTVSLSIYNPTSNTMPEQRLHVRAYASQDGWATRGIYHYWSGSWQETIPATNGELLSASDPAVQSSDGWILERQQGRCLKIKPTNTSALDMTLSTSPSKLKYIRIGCGGWIPAPMGSPVNVGYTLSCVNKP